MKKIVLALALFLAATPALSQFSTPPEVQVPGGPAAIGHAMAQVDPGTGKVAIVQSTAAPPAASGGVIQLSAFGWLQPYVDTLVQLLITSGFAWIGKSKYSQWLDQSSRDALETFAKNRASSLIADGAVRLQGKAVHVDNDFLLRAASESATAIPDALKRFGLTPDVVAAKIIDAIPQTQAGAAIIANAHAEEPAAVPVTVADRPPAAPAPKGANPPTTA